MVYTEISSDRLKLLDVWKHLDLVPQESQRFVKDHAELLLQPVPKVGLKIAKS